MKWLYTSTLLYICTIIITSACRSARSATDASAAERQEKLDSSMSASDSVSAASLMKLSELLETSCEETLMLQFESGGGSVRCDSGSVRFERVKAFCSSRQTAQGRHVSSEAKADSARVSKTQDSISAEATDKREELADKPPEANRDWFSRHSYILLALVLVLIFLVHYFLSKSI